MNCVSDAVNFHINFIRYFECIFDGCANQLHLERISLLEFGTQTNASTDMNMKCTHVVQNRKTDL